MVVAAPNWKDWVAPAEVVALLLPVVTALAGFAPKLKLGLAGNSAVGGGAVVVESPPKTELLPAADAFADGCPKALPVLAVPKTDLKIGAAELLAGADTGAG